MSLIFGMAAAVSIGASLMAYALARYANGAALDARTRRKVRRRALLWFMVGGVALGVMGASLR